MFKETTKIKIDYKINILTLTPFVQRDYKINSLPLTPFVHTDLRTGSVKPTRSAFKNLITVFSDFRERNRDVGSIKQDTAANRGRLLTPSAV